MCMEGFPCIIAAPTPSSAPWLCHRAACSPRVAARILLHHQRVQICLYSLLDALLGESKWRLMLGKDFPRVFKMHRTIAKAKNCTPCGAAGMQQFSCPAPQQQRALVPRHLPLLGVKQQLQPPPPPQCCCNLAWDSAARGAATGVLCGDKAPTKPGAAHLSAARLLKPPDPT